MIDDRGMGYKQGSGSQFITSESMNNPNNSSEKLGPGGTQQPTSATLITASTETTNLTQNIRETLSDKTTAVILGLIAINALIYVSYMKKLKNT